jgi:hypothetical protein
MDPFTTSAADLRTHIESFSTEPLAYYFGDENSNYSEGWKIHQLEGTAASDLQVSLGQDQFVIGILERDNSDTYYLTFDGWDEANPPFIVVSYSIP